MILLSTVPILVGVIVPVLVIVGILVLVMYLRKRTVPQQSVPGTTIGQLCNGPEMRGHDEITYPPTYEDIELRFSAFSNTEYAEVADIKGEQRNEKMYENFQPTSEKKQNQYEALQLPTGLDSSDDDHLYAKAQPK
jgi:hypothetical protein